jgi:beta-1,2-mannosidase
VGGPLQRDRLREVYLRAREAKLSPLFQTLSSDRLSRDYDPCDWAIGPFERVDRLAFRKVSQWKDPWEIGWEGHAVHNASLIEEAGRLHMFYRCNPSMEGLSARIGLAVHDERTGWADHGDNPLIYPTLENEGLGCEDPKIYRAEGRYFLFYLAIFPPSGEDHARYDDAGFPVGDVACENNLAVSDDLVHWEKRGPIIPRSLSRLWAKSAVIPRSGNGDAVRIDGRYLMFVSEGCGGRQMIGASTDMVHWDFHHEQFLDTRPLGRLNEVMSAVIDGERGEHLVMDFFYDDGSGVARAGEALYRPSAPTKQVALNRGGTLNAGGMIRCQGRWMHAQGWDAPPGEPTISFYAATTRGLP